MILGAASFTIPAGLARDAICVLAVLVSVVAVLTGAWARPSDHRRSGGDLTRLLRGRTHWHTRTRLGRRLAYRALHDPLTGLANLDLFVGRVERAVRPDTPPGMLAVVLVDLDDLKTVNDCLGHTVGDRLLVAASARIASCAAPTDTIARMDEDEFGIFLEGIDSTARAAQVAERILACLDEPFDLGPTTVSVGASVGVSLNRRGDQAVSLITNADMALHAAKDQGKARVVTFDSGLHGRGLERLRLTTDMTLALQRGEFLPLYQPIVDIEGGDIVGVEALVRWDHPTRGLLAPSEFIAFAEESGLIVPMGLDVLRRACRQVRDWNDRFSPSRPLRVSVNLSPRQIQMPGIVADVERVLREEALDPGLLTLEITETIVLADTDASVATLHRLKALGVKLALDDFGTGYSSLSYLQRLPVDVLKLDRSFVDQLGRPDRGDSRLAGAIIGLGRTLDLVTSAEGVERSEQLSRLRKLGCQLGQGYFFARPLPARELEQTLLVRAAAVMSMAGPATGRERPEPPY